MSIAAIIYLAIVFASWLVAANLHGKERTGKYNFWTTVLASCITLPLLWWGGFFN